MDKLRETIRLAIIALHKASDGDHASLSHASSLVDDAMRMAETRGTAQPNPCGSLIHEIRMLGSGGIEHSLVGGEPGHVYDDPPAVLARLELLGADDTDKVRLQRGNGPYNDTTLAVVVREWGY